jgi:hypothetical protein
VDYFSQEDKSRSERDRERRDHTDYFGLGDISQSEMRHTRKVIALVIMW